MTRHQRRILDAIAAFIGAKGYCPTLQQIAAPLGVSKVSVYGHVRALRNLGLVALRPRRRGIDLTDAGKLSAATLNCPHCGKSLVPCPSVSVSDSSVETTA